MRQLRCLDVFAAVAALTTLAYPALAAEFDVPLTHATLQLAVGAAAASPDVDNTITLSASPLVTNATVDIGAAFGPARHLVIRPAAALERASLVCTFPTVPIITMALAANVALQDLDIVRNITNGQHLVTLSTCADIVIERCRIGSNWSTAGTPGWSNVFMLYPTNVLLRNNILFARVPGTFDYGINAGSFNDPSNALRLYNNVVSDYKLHGVRIEAAIAGPLVLLRNNVVVNHVALAPEPIAYRTEAAIGGPLVVSSHNVAYASGGFVESGPGGTQDIAGMAASFLALPRASVGVSFVTPTWTVAPLWDANLNLYRLVDGGPLHTNSSQWGMTVGNVGPDFAVSDDIERDIRPGGVIPHTDRGADQLEPGTSLAVPPLGDPNGLLEVVRPRTPARTLECAYRVAEAGLLEWLVLDPAGRMLHRAQWSVLPGSRGVLQYRNAAAPVPTLAFYRVRLRTAEGRNAMISGKAILLP